MSSPLIYMGNKSFSYKIIMIVWIHCQKRESNQIYTILYSSSKNTELIEPELGSY